MADLKVDVCCSQRHYLAHALPIWEKLPERMKGDVHRLRSTVSSPRDHRRICMVAGWPDVQSLRGRHRMIYVEHGAGQSYGGDPKSAHFPGYSLSGGSRHRGVIGFIAPNDVVASRWKTAPSVAVGCPKMDAYLGMEPDFPKSVCFAWHFDSGVCPEASSAWGHYKNDLAPLVAEWERQGWRVFGHAHPRWRGQLDAPMELMGLEVLQTDSQVFRNAGVVMVDNSSLGVEAMLLNRPVVWLNAPQYRRDVHHGGRFWEWTEGAILVDGPDELWGSFLDDVALLDGYWEGPRGEVVSKVYAIQDGTSSQRAADWITDLVDALP